MKERNDAKYTKRKATKIQSKPIKRKRVIASKCKATTELKARHLANLCAEFESLRGANG
jgi:hypothetical protein